MQSTTLDIMGVPYVLQINPSGELKVDWDVKKKTITLSTSKEGYQDHPQEIYALRRAIMEVYIVECGNDSFLRSIEDAKLWFVRLGRRIVSTWSIAEMWLIERSAESEQEEDQPIPVNEIFESRADLYPTEKKRGKVIGSYYANITNGDDPLTGYDESFWKAMREATGEYFAWHGDLYVKIGFETSDNVCTMKAVPSHGEYPDSITEFVKDMLIDSENSTLYFHDLFSVYDYGVRSGYLKCPEISAAMFYEVAHAIMATLYPDKERGKIEEDSYLKIGLSGESVSEFMKAVQSYKENGTEKTEEAPMNDTPDEAVEEQEVKIEEVDETPGLELSPTEFPDIVRFITEELVVVGTSVRASVSLGELYDLYQDAYTKKVYSTSYKDFPEFVRDLIDALKKVFDINIRVNVDAVSSGRLIRGVSRKSNFSLS